MTYRSNLLDADFMILIIKEDYGTETENGISGIHEEYKIASNNDIPLHVYLKINDSSSKEDNPLVEELKKDGISYYYFKNDNDLLKRLKETTFTIAKEIMTNQIDKDKIPEETIIRMAGNKDYKRAMQVVSIIEAMIDIKQVNDLDWIYSDIFTHCLECIAYEFSSMRHHFINWKIEEQLRNIINIANEFIEHSGLDFTVAGGSRECNISILGNVRVYNLSYYKNTDWEISDYKKTLQNFFDAYRIFKSEVQNLRTEIDLLMD